MIHKHGGRSKSRRRSKARSRGAREQQQQQQQKQQQEQQQQGDQAYEEGGRITNIIAALGQTNLYYRYY